MSDTYPFERYHGWVDSDHNGKTHYHDETGMAMYYDDDTRMVAVGQIDHREPPPIQND